jgi:hypothetical protein
MKRTIKKMASAILPAASCLALFSILSQAAFRLPTQEKPKREVIQAQAMGQSQAAGKQFNITINIESYSTPEDQKMLIDAFTSGGHDGLVKALSKMESKGRVAITGTIGYDIAYIRTFSTENGRTIRLITDRPINFAEAYNSGRSTDYDLSGIQLNIAGEQKKSDGALVVAGRFMVDKNQEVTFESYGSGPWRLTNVMER